MCEVRTSRKRRFLVLRDAVSRRLLEVGTVLTGKDLEDLEGSFAVSAGLALSYRLLSGRDRTEWEIRSSLAGEGIVRPQVVGDIVETLRRQGYLDDRRLAADYIRYMTNHRPSGPHLLRQKLKRMGVSEDIIESEIHSAFSRKDEREIALELARQRFKGGMGRERAVRRIQGFLTRRGFQGNVVNEICAKILRGEIPEGIDE